MSITDRFNPRNHAADEACSCEHPASMHGDLSGGVARCKGCHCRLFVVDGRMSDAESRAINAARWSDSIETVNDRIAAAIGKRLGIGPPVKVEGPMEGGDVEWFCGDCGESGVGRHDGCPGGEQ